uniref:Haloacid dehalogenase-like hydrolase domain containing 2 n=1 Tax=Cyprinus carpio carpio TaxID=630221 RepID=A0A9J7YCF5_CYPCA
NLCHALYADPRARVQTELYFRLKLTLFERLHWLNFDLQEQEIFTSLTAACNLLEQRAVRPLLLVEDSLETLDPNAVVIGLAPDHFNYQTLNKAFRKDGLALGPGLFVTGLEYATDTQATALRDLNCSPEEAVVIGDDARGDVSGAQNAGMLGILVKTGRHHS